MNIGEKRIVIMKNVLERRWTNFLINCQGWKYDEVLIMCDWNKYGDTRIDPCMRKIIEYLNYKGITTLACCCGHGRWPMSIVVRFEDGRNLDICSGKFIINKKRFYKRDSKGYYYIPEALFDDKK